MNNPAGYNQLPNDPYGQPQYGQQPYGQPPYQQPQYNQQPNYQQPYGQGGYVPPQNYSFPSSQRGIEQLASLPAIFIKQKFQVLEAITGCQQQNEFFVYPADEKGQMIPNSSPIYAAKENSECCQRILCPADMRAFEMNVYEFVDGIDSKGNPNQSGVLKFYRDYQFTCWCFNRPELQVENLNMGNPFHIGRILSPYLICRLGLDIFSKEDVPKYSIDGSICQCGILCQQLPCAPCQKAKFNVLEYNSKSALAPLFKRNAGCCKACFESISDFSVIFPGSATTEDKALLMASAIFLDYRYFEENKLDEKNQRRHNH